MILVVDTHSLLWYLTGDRRLGSAAKAALDESEARHVIPSMALAEAYFLIGRDRVQVSWERVLDVVEADPRTSVHPLTIEVIVRIPTALNIHDGIIWATALLYQTITDDDVVVVTKDREIAASGLVRTVW